MKSINIVSMTVFIVSIIVFMYL